MNRRTIVLLTLILLTSAIISGCDLSLPVDVEITPLPTEEVTPTTEPTHTPEATPTIEPTPEPTSTPEPTPTMDMLDGAPVLERYITQWPENAEFDLKYKKYKIYPSYFVSLKSANIRKLPTTKSPVVNGLSFGQRIELVASVEVADRIWYRVQWTKKGETHYGYMHESTGSPRVFQVDKMLDRAQKLKDIIDAGQGVYINNYKNLNGSAPRLPSGKYHDEYGQRRSQSAPGYEKPDITSTFRYIPDGMLGIVEEEKDDFKKVYIPTYDESLWIPIKYLSKDDAVKELTQMIVVDRENQNSGTLEWSDNKWKIISLSFVSTGKTGQYSLPTPLGNYMAIQRRSKFRYYHDGTTDIAGYAPYTIRFSCGGYLHGVPRVYGKDAAGNLVDPGHAEALRSLGTTPRSHMCVRNYTSHAKFLYDWVDIGNCAVIVIE